MDIMCLMGLFPNGYEDEITQNTIVGMQNAANKLQWGIVKGLDSQEQANVSICNSLYIGSYPKRYRKMIIPTFSFEHIKGANDINLGFLNLPVIKNISRYISIKHYLKRWAKKNSSSERALLVYALTTPFVKAAAYIQRNYPLIKVCMVVPDLPEYMNVGAMQKDGLYSRLKRLQIKWMKKSLRSIKYYVLLTEAMKNWFEHDIKYTVVEGIASCTDVISTKNEREKTIIYAGGISKEYGVFDLIETFMQINMPEWKLVIYGDGKHLNDAKELAQNDARVVFMGLQPNSVVVEHQKRASLLVNPRKNQEFTKYSFPSKILEYMSSGTPMLAYKLDGVPDEYTPYYYRISEESGGLYESLKVVMQQQDYERNLMGKKAMTFVRENKNPIIQARKIIDLIFSH
ncbi:MAG: glycosyltransferase family 4 protein [Clostridiales bacterium]|nr:glycosyltransferase family 4 protein [Clostridiales bacterium]